MPLPMRGNGAKNFKFEKLLQSGNSETLQQHALTVEYTSNPPGMPCNRCLILTITL